MSGSDLRRFRLIQDVIEGRRTQLEVAIELGICVRQVRRIQRAVELDGGRAIPHSLRGKKGNRALSDNVKQQILNIWKDKYREAGLNFNHFTEKLNEVEELKVSRDAVRRLLRAAGAADRPPKKGRIHRRHRQRRAQFGELLQQDTSPHDWLGTGQMLQLLVIVDDATSRLLFCRLFEHDGTLANMIAMKEVFLKHGLPMASYADRASWFFVTLPKHTHGTQAALERGLKTQIGRALEELGVEFIPAYSPQAKGRVERANGTLQDRLVAELKLRKISDINVANQFIEEVFIPDYNKRFGKDPADPTPAFVPVSDQSQIEQALCLKYICTVAKDNTVTRSKLFKLQLMPSQHRLNWHRAKIEVRIYPDLSLRVLYFPNQKDVPFEIIELHSPHEPKKPNEPPTLHKISA